MLVSFINSWRTLMKVCVFRTYLQFDTTVMEHHTRKNILLVESLKCFEFKVKNVFI